MSFLNIANLTSSRAPKRLLEKIAQIVFKGAGRHFKISLVFLNPKAIKDLNRKYRKKNKATDVLSFEYGEKKEGYFGEIFICPSQVKRQAQEKHSSFETELTRVFVHGILHLRGYDHKTKKEFQAMEKKTEDILKQI